MHSTSNLVFLRNGKSEATIHPHGATVVSWKINGEEILFLSKKAVLDGSKPIRGGIPLVFPQFGTGPIMAGQHGFARTLPWKINVLESGSTAICSLSDSPETLAVWPFKFSLNYSATIESDGSLTTEFRVTNTNDKALDFTALLHTYFKVPGIEQFTVAGLQGLTYQDKLKAGSSFVETRNDISIEEEVDRNYLSVPEIVKFSNGKGQVTIKKSETLPDLVLWNPWIEKSKKMSDFDDDEYKEMVCLEAGKIGKPQSLEPGQDWTASQTLSFDPKTSNL